MSNAFFRYTKEVVMDLVSVDDMEFFDQVAHSTSLTEAARSWGKSVSAVSKRLSQLESRLGAQLVRRSTRKLALTEEGLRYAEGIKRIIREKIDLEDALFYQHGQLRGRITVHSTPGFGRTHIAPLLGEFLSEHPDVEIDLELSPLPLNIANTTFDVAIRIGALVDSRLKARMLAQNRRIVCAAPSYLIDHAEPRNLSDLDQHDCIVLKENSGDYALWRFGDRGEKYVRVSGSLTSDDGDVVTDWCVQGHGLMMRSTWHVGPLIQDELLVQVLPSVPTPEANIFALYPSEAQVPRRVSALVDYLEVNLPVRLGGVTTG
ncbi:LysR family transcriptional regulator [Glutamicibacter halophytocola]|uniref:LysR family transcriptional regulator n=1 Tax=Glutamicibacter halophytocola TaxID=1933880 RepID=UPI00321946B4